MVERQLRSGLDGLDGDVAADLPDESKLEQLFNQEASVVLQIRNDNFEQVIGVTRDHVASDNMRHGRDKLLKGYGLVISVAADLYADGYR
jgi:hypothetical protein